MHWIKVKLHCKKRKKKQNIIAMWVLREPYTARMFSFVLKKEIKATWWIEMRMRFVLSISAIIPSNLAYLDLFVHWTFNVSCQMSISSTRIFYLSLSCTVFIHESPLKGKTACECLPQITFCIIKMLQFITYNLNTSHINCSKGDNY